MSWRTWAQMRLIAVGIRCVSSWLGSALSPILDSSCVLWPKLHGWMWWTRERNITMDWEMEQARLLILDSEMDHLDTEPPEEVVARIVGRYVNFLGPRNQSESPLWRLVQDIQRQAAVPAHIIEHLKAGENVSDVRRLFY